MVPEALDASSYRLTRPAFARPLALTYLLAFVVAVEGFRPPRRRGSYNRDGYLPTDMDDELAWEAVDSERAYTCPGFDVVHENVRLPDGTVTDFDYLTEPPSVVVLPFTDDGEVVLIEEWRQAVRRVNRGLPAGTVDPDDEDLAASVRRELAEETGYVPDEVAHLLSTEPANGYADSVHHHYVARGCTPDADQDLDDDESIRVTTTAFETLKAEVAAGDLPDGRTVTAVAHYEAFGP